MKGNTTMQKLTLATVTAATLGAVILTGCGVDNDDDRCRTATPVYYFMGADHHYHYGSPTGQTVPHWKLPKSATKAPGYRPVPGTLKKPVNPNQRGNTGGPAAGTKPLPKAPAAPKAPAPKAPAPAPAPKAPSFTKR